jgi:hypothetical protein
VELVGRREWQRPLPLPPQNISAGSLLREGWQGREDLKDFEIFQFVIDLTGVFGGKVNSLSFHLTPKTPVRSTTDY